MTTDKAIDQQEVPQAAKGDVKEALSFLDYLQNLRRTEMAREHPTTAVGVMRYEEVKAKDDKIFEAIRQAAAKHYSTVALTDDVERILSMSDEEIIADAGGEEEAAKIADGCRKIFDETKLRVEFAECLKQVILGNEYPNALFTKIIRPYLRPTPPRVDIGDIEEALNNAREFISGYIDVVDGNYGQPAPNKAMILDQELQAALAVLHKAQGLTEGGKAPDLAALEVAAIESMLLNHGKARANYDSSIVLCLSKEELLEAIRQHAAQGGE